MSNVEKKALGCGLGCGLITLEVIALITAFVLGGIPIFLMTLGATLLLFVLVAIRTYIANAPQRMLEAERRRKEREAREARAKAEASIKNGQLTDGLRYFWRVRDLKRIKHCLSVEVKLPSRGLNDWLKNTDAPDFKKIILKIFDNMVTIWNYVSSPSNTFISQDLTNDVWFQLSDVADYLWVIVHRLSVIALSGAKANNDALRRSFKEMEHNLNQVSNKVDELLSVLRNYVAEPHQYELGIKETLAAVDVVIDQVKQQTTVEKEIKSMLGELPTYELWENRLKTEPLNEASTNETSMREDLFSEDRFKEQPPMREKVPIPRKT